MPGSKQQLENLSEYKPEQPIVGIKEKSIQFYNFR
jgi:hypothetical protein